MSYKAEQTTSITPADTALVIAINARLRGYVGKRAEIRILKHVIAR